jgi:xanthine dehydrogenase accessory factor
MNDYKLWQFIYENLKKNNPIILTVVLESKGSSPGKAGFKIAIAEKNKFVGTIGGGQMELDLIKECKEWFGKKSKLNIYRKLYHSEKVKKLKSGLVCQGNQTNFICMLDKSDIHIVKSIIQAYERSKKGLLEITPNGLDIKFGKTNSIHINYHYTSENKWVYQENIGLKDTIYIFGGGHVGLALSKQMKLLNFEVIVFDDRRNVQTIKENKSADKIIIASYRKVGKYVIEGNYSYAAIVTSALPTDKLVLKQIAGLNLKYIGLMGSKAKLKRIFSELKLEGIEEKYFKKVNAPIGLEINSNTVEEIAVSIAAQIIQVKNQNN